NPLFFKENTQMLFGDAKANVNAILGELAVSGSGQSKKELATTAA
ncbi:MAG: hypothetical protein AAF651_14640, partial [Cyanobacteria bacterium P01_C01_bin.73]